MKSRLELKEGTSSKFWEIASTGRTIVTRWGRIGAAPREATKTYDTAALAAEAAARQIAEKTGKGYVAAGAKATAKAPVKSKPKAKTAVNDLTRIRDAFQAASKGDFVALANAGTTQDDGWDDVREVLGDREVDAERATAVFWHRQSQARGFKQGRLVGPLALYWAGDKKRIAAFLRGIGGYEVEVPSDEDSAFMLTPKSDP